MMGNIKKSLYITISNGINYVISIVFKFIIRSLVVNFISPEYLGLNSYFLSIISILAITELGLGTTLMSFLFKPLEANDYFAVSKILEYFKKIYKYVGIIFLTMACLVFLIMISFIPETTISLTDIVLLYFVLILPEFLKYFFFEHLYILFNADHKSFLYNFPFTFLFLIQYVIEILILLIFKNFILFSLIITLGNIARGLVVFHLFKKNYREKLKMSLNNYNFTLTSLNIKNSIKNIFFIKISERILESSDTILISNLIGFFTLGILSNYLLVINLVFSLLSIFRSSFHSLIGKVYYSTNPHSFIIYKSLVFINFILVLNFSLLFYSLIQPFVSIWVGDFYLIDNNLVIILTLNFFLMNSNYIAGITYQALGLFNYGKYIKILTIILNVILSLTLSFYLGLAGILIGTFVSYFLTILFYYPYLISKHVYRDSFWSFSKNFFIFFILLILFVLTTNFGFFYNNILLLLLMVFLLNLILYYIFKDTSEFLFIRNKVIKFNIFFSSKKQ